MLQSVTQITTDIDQLISTLNDKETSFTSIPSPNKRTSFSVPIKSTTNPLTCPKLPEILPRWRYCPEIDEIFYSTDDTKIIKSNHKTFTILTKSQLDARSINSFLYRLRTFDDSWKFTDNLSPLELAANGWKRVSGDIIVCCEDLNKTLVVVDKSTSMQNLKQKLAIKGCTFSFKSCPIDKFSNQLTHFTTISFKNLLQNENVIENDLIMTLQQKYLKFKMTFLNFKKFNFEEFYEKLTKNNVLNVKLQNFIQNKNFVKLITKKRSNAEISTKDYTILILILTGWNIKFNNSNGKFPSIFCLFTDNCHSLENFDPKNCHYHWCPWNNTANNDQFIEKIEQYIKFSLTKEKRSSAINELSKKDSSRLRHLSSNNNVDTFMKSLTHINRKKRKKSLSEAKNESKLNDSSVFLINKRLTTIEDVEQRIKFCNRLCNDSLGKSNFIINEDCNFLNVTI